MGSFRLFMRIFYAHPGFGTRGDPLYDSPAPLPLKISITLLLSAVPPQRVVPDRRDLLLQQPGIGGNNMNDPAGLFVLEFLFFVCGDDT